MRTTTPALSRSGTLARKLRGLVRRPAQRMIQLAGIQHRSQPGAGLGGALHRQQQRQQPRAIGRAGIFAQRLPERHMLRRACDESCAVYVAIKQRRISVAGTGPACAARSGAARIRRRGQPRQAAVAAAAGAARRRDLRLAATDDGCRRDVSSAALGATRGVALLASVPDLESAGVVVRMPATWRASRPPRPQVTGTVGARKPPLSDSRACWISVWRDAGRRDPDGERNRGAAGRHRRACAAAGPMGRGGSRSPRANDRTIPGSGGPGGAERPELRRGDAHAGWARSSTAPTRRRQPPTGHR